MTGEFVKTEQARAACEELERAINHLGDAAVKLIMAEREECAMTLDGLAGAETNPYMKKALEVGASAIRSRRTA